MLTSSSREKYRARSQRFCFRLMVGDYFGGHQVEVSKAVFESPTYHVRCWKKMAIVRDRSRIYARKVIFSEGVVEVRSII